MRGGIKRSRNGCKQCKDRKLKCDEARPSCGRCTKRRVTCTSSFLSNTTWDESLGNLSRLSTARSITNASTIDLQGTNSQGDLVQAASEFSNSFHGLWTDREEFETSESEPMLLHHFDTEAYIDPLTPEHASQEQPASLIPSRTVSESLSLSASRDPGLASQPSKTPFCSVLSPPALDKPIRDCSFVLVEYYFKEVAGLFSCYDSPRNPFRSAVSRTWQSSSSVFLVIQSMAAACLADVFPEFHGIGCRLRDRAAAAVEAKIRSSGVDTNSLLTLIMLGLSASWHHANNLGRKEFDYARTIIDMINKGKIPSFDSSNRNMHFFQEAMIYWEMLMSHVVDIDSLLPTAQVASAPKFPANRLEPKLPHPWTGVASEAHLVVSKMGRLIRQERGRMRNRPFFSTPADLDASQRALDTARQLANQLENLVLPDPESIIDTEDAQTPARDLLNVAEAYRLAGLLQLYRVFPDLLLSPCDGQMQSPGLHQRQNAGENVEGPGFEMLSSMALRITSLLRAIPVESGTGCVQPFVLVVAASELRLGPWTTPVPYMSEISATIVGASSTTRAIETLEARKFVLGRLSTFEHVLPGKPIRQMAQIVKHTWDQMDRGLENIYWIDVMTEKGWETIMG